MEDQSSRINYVELRDNLTISRDMTEKNGLGQRETDSLRNPAK